MTKETKLAELEAAADRRTIARKAYHAAHSLVRRAAAARDAAKDVFRAAVEATYLADESYNAALKAAEEEGR